MIQGKKQLLRFLVAISICLSIIQPANGTTTSFTVSKGDKETIPLSLEVEDHVSVKFTVVGQTENILDFCIIDPHENVKVEYRNVGNVNYFFVCDEPGEYILRFSNTNTSEEKLVTLNYEVQHYIFGIPQMLFLTIIILLVCLAAVATFILMGKPH